MITRLKNKILKEIAMTIGKKKAFLSGDKKMVSFSFDDFPLSAVENGARLLELKNVYGTFYASLGLSGGANGSGQIGTKQEMLDIAKRGHELACHTFGHLSCTAVSAKSIIKNCELNKKVARDLANIHLQSFAYPFGVFSPSTKKAISRLYKCARTIEPGINNHVFDLAALRSISLYEKDGIGKVKLWLSKLENSSGWLIFYTHDVSDSPSEFGCSIELFSKTLDLCFEKGFKILTIAESVKMCTFLSNMTL